VARRSEDWNVGLAKDLRDAAFPREFLLASIDEGVHLQLALGNGVRILRTDGGRPTRSLAARLRRRMKLPVQR
jgi:hypothetical protein